MWRHGIPSFIALNWDFPANEHPDYVSSQLSKYQSQKMLSQDALGMIAREGFRLLHHLDLYDTAHAWALDACQASLCLH